jgi:pimeloyl-ACP methyl ester carboxylesterase
VRPVRACAERRKVLTSLHTSSVGDGPALLLIHPTGTGSDWFAPVVDRLAPSRQVILYDRLGWGRSRPAGDYLRTSIAEQSIEAAGVLKEHGVTRTEVVGFGFGAVVALELALAEPDMLERAILVEPPLFDTLTDATEGMSQDVAAIRDAAEAGGEDAVWRLFLGGGLPTLGAGAERLVAQGDCGAGPTAAHTLLVELPAVPAWPLDPVRAGDIQVPVSVVTTPSAPDLLRRAADALVPRIPGAVRVEAQVDGPLAAIGLAG